VDLAITGDSIKVTAQSLSGGAGLGGTDAHALQQGLLRFGKSSRDLRQTTADMVPQVFFSTQKKGSHKVTLSMFGYGIGILPLICRLKHEFPAVKQPWYANDAGSLPPGNRASLWLFLRP
jgi:hypothetical protein